MNPTVAQTSRGVGAGRRKPSTAVVCDVMGNYNDTAGQAGRAGKLLGGGMHILDDRNLQKC